MGTHREAEHGNPRSHRLPSARARAWWPWLAMLMLALLALRLGQWLTPFGVASSPDTLVFMDLAEGVAHHGELTVASNKPELSERMPVVLWAPLYSIVIALFLHGSLPVVMAVSVVNQLALAATALLIHGLFRRLLPVLAAAALAAVSVLNPAVQLLFTYGWSEVLAVPLGLFCLLACLHSGEARRQGRQVAMLAWASAAAVGSGLAITARYGAVPFLFLTCATLLLQGGLRDWKRGLALGSFAAIVTGIVITPLLWRSVQLSGHLGGGDRGAPTMPLGEYLDGVLGALDFYVFRGHVLWILGAVALLLALAQWRRWPADRRVAFEAPSAQGVAMVWTAGAWALGYLLSITLIGRVVNTDYDARMANVLVPLLMVGTCGGLALYALHRRSRLGSLPLLAWLLFCSVHGLASLQQTRANWLARGTPDLPIYGSGRPQVYNNFTNNPSFEVLRVLGEEIRAAGLAQVVFIDRNSRIAPAVFRFVTGLPARWMPDALDASAQEVLTKLSGHGGALLLVDGAGMEALRGALGGDLSGVRVLPETRHPGVRIVALPLH